MVIGSVQLCSACHGLVHVTETNLKSAFWWNASHAMSLNLRRAITGHEKWKLRVQHQVQVAHLVIVSGSGIDRLLDSARVKHARCFQCVARPDLYVLL